MSESHLTFFPTHELIAELKRRAPILLVYQPPGPIGCALFHITGAPAERTWLLAAAEELIQAERDEPSEAQGEPE